MEMVDIVDSRSLLKEKLRLMKAARNLSSDPLKKDMSRHEQLQRQGPNSIINVEYGAKKNIKP